MARKAAGVRTRLRAGNDEGRLSRAAAAGESRAATALIRRHAQLAFNLALRVTGSEADARAAAKSAFVEVLGPPSAIDGQGERALAVRLLGAVRAACHAATAQGGAGSGDHGEPPGAGAGRAASADRGAGPLLEDWQEDVHAANAGLPASRREVLALRELCALSYVEIAQVMEIGHDSVAPLIAEARIGLRDGLRRPAAEPVSSEDCDEALELMAMRDDGELTDPEDADWLIGHLTACRGCRNRLDAMQEARLAYSGWEPATAPATLLAGVPAAGAGPRGVAVPAPPAAGAGPAAGADRAEVAGAPSPPPVSGEARRRLRREVVLAGGWGAVLLLGVVAVLAGGVSGDPEREDPPEATLTPPAQPAPATRGQAAAPQGRPKKRRRRPEQPSRPQPVVSRQAAPAPVVVAAPPAREPTRTAPRPRRRPEAKEPSAAPPETTPAPQQQAPGTAPEPDGAAPPAPTTPQQQQPQQQPPPAAGCTNPAGKPVPC